AHFCPRKPAAGVKSEAGASAASESLPSETLPGELSGTGESAAELSTAESAAATEPAAAELESTPGSTSGSGRREVQLTESAEVEGAGVPAVLVPAVSVPSVQQGPDTASWVLGVGFLLMALIHLSQFRRRFFRLLRSAVRLLKLALIEYPLRVARLPAVQAIWRHRAVVRFRRVVVVPAIVAWPLFRGIPGLFLGSSPGWLWYLSGCVLCSLALNSRPGQDAQELTSEWLANAWHKLQARIFVALLDLLLEFFRMVLNLIERFLYAVDEWLRFHSEESWLSIVVKAVLGVVWSFVSFLIRIYVNLLIEPTFHPVKHFPVVTVAHKMILPGLVLLQGSM
ncbi:MAG: hypothetical protein ACKON9_13490, partial [Planctomycetaceae bacterium]